MNFFTMVRSLLVIALCTNITGLVASEPTPTETGAAKAPASIDAKCQFAIRLLNATFNQAAPELTPALQGALKIAATALNEAREAHDDETLTFDGAITNQLAEKTGVVITCFVAEINKKIVKAVHAYNHAFSRPLLVLNPTQATAQDAMLKLTLQTGMSTSEISLSKLDPHEAEAARDQSAEEDKPLTTEEKDHLLSIAITTKQFDCAEWLLEQGADLNFIDRHGLTLLDRAMLRENAPQIAWLLAHGARHTPQAPTPKAVELLFEAVILNKKDHIKELLETGININTPDARGLNALMFALLDKNFELANWLFDNGADPHQKFIGGTTILLAAAGSNLQAVIEWLINHGVDVNTPAEIIGITALDLAEIKGHKELAEWLVTQGARRKRS